MVKVSLGIKSGVRNGMEVKERFIAMSSIKNHPTLGDLCGQTRLCLDTSWEP